MIVSSQETVTCQKLLGMQFLIVILKSKIKSGEEKNSKKKNPNPCKAENNWGRLPMSPSFSPFPRHPHTCTVATNTCAHMHNTHMLTQGESARGQRDALAAPQVQKARGHWRTTSNRKTEMCVWLSTPHHPNYFKRLWLSFIENSAKQTNRQQHPNPFHH